MQFVTAVGALLGTLIGLATSFHPLLYQFLLSVTTGGFLYIATVTMLPSLASNTGSRMQIVIDAMAFVLGVLMMVAVGMLEE